MSTVAALTLLVSTLKVTSLYSLPSSPRGEAERVEALQMNKGGHLLLSMETEGGGKRRMQRFSLSSDFRQRGCSLAPLISRLVVPPDVFVTGDSLLLHKDASSTPGGTLPLVLMLHSTAQVAQAGQFTSSYHHFTVAAA